MLKNRNFIEIESPENDIGLTGQSTVMRVKCRRCRGEGEIKEIIYPYQNGQLYDIKECPNCKGSGWMDAVVFVKFEPVKFITITSKI